MPCLMTRLFIAKEKSLDCSHQSDQHWLFNLFTLFNLVTFSDHLIFLGLFFPIQAYGDKNLDLTAFAAPRLKLTEGVLLKCVQFDDI